jgi:hypothetical protein
MTLMIILSAWLAIGLLVVVAIGGIIVLERWLDIEPGSTTVPRNDILYRPFDTPGYGGDGGC